MIENFSMDDENSTIKLTSAKVTLQSRINKVKQQDEEILKTWTRRDELEEISIREEHLQILIKRIEHCLSKPKIHVDRDSLPSSDSSPLPINEV